MSGQPSLPVGTPTPGTRLIWNPEELQVISLRRETDVRTAITLGLAEYLRTLTMPWKGGHHVQFARVLETWAQTEVPAQYPSACVYALDPGQYDASSFTPVYKTTVVDGVGVMQTCEFVLQCTVEIWSTDPDERVRLVSMVEDAFNPVDWMYGFRLEFPHYHNMRSDFSPESLMYVEDSDEAQRRYRKVLMTVTGRCPVVRRLTDATGRPVPRADVRVEYEFAQGADPDAPPGPPTGGVGTGLGGGLVDLTGGIGTGGAEPVPAAPGRRAVYGGTRTALGPGKPR